MPTPLENLLKKERHIYGRLDSWMARTTMEDTDIEALGLQYEKCLTDILDYISTNPNEVTQKFEFVFDVIRRSYEDQRFLELMKASLAADIATLKTNQGFG